VALIDALSGAAPKVFSVGPQPYSATCFDSYYPFVSTFGDSALSMLDPATGTVTLKIPNIAGSRSGQGVGVGSNANFTGPGLAFVVGTDANVVTVVNAAQGNVVASFPVPQPIALVTATDGFGGVVSASGGVTLLNPGTLDVVPGTGVASQAEPIGSLVFGTSVYASDSIAVSNGSVVDTVFRAGANPQLSVGSVIQASFTVPGISGAADVVWYCVPYASCGFIVTLPGSDSVASITPLTGPYAVGVVNAATFAVGGWGPAGARPLPNGAPPGALATTFTPYPNSVGTAQYRAAALPLPTSLGGVSVSVGGTATYSNSTSAWTHSSTGSVLAPLLYVSESQINFQMPPGIQGELVPIQINYPDGAALLTSVRAGSTDPGIFTLTSVPTGPAAVLNQDNSVNLGGNPAARGSVIQIFATGAGATNPSLAAGVPAPASGSPLIYTQVQPTVTIGGVNAAVQFSGLAPGFVGVWQINAVVPPTVTPGSTVSLSVTAGGIQSNTATIAVK
jgi:uncharacterized protein (TIGR03437 family)